MTLLFGHHACAEEKHEPAENPASIPKASVLGEYHCLREIRNSHELMTNDEIQKYKVGSNTVFYIGPIHTDRKHIGKLWQSRKCSWVRWELHSDVSLCAS